MCGSYWFYDSKIKGISIDNVEYKLSQFSDDTVLFLYGSEEFMSAAFHTLDLDASLLKVLNIEKTQAVGISSKMVAWTKYAMI